MGDRYMQPNVLEQILDGNMKPTDLRLALLENITDNFSAERKIGVGGFGTVYKGVLRNGNVAVKMMNNHSIDDKLFRREVNSLMKVNHRNAVRFLGFCSNSEHKAIQIGGSTDYIFAEVRQRLLCFEYISNGSLDIHITDELRGLEWNTRYQIIKGICDGLHHLHKENGLIHMDLKPTNILLDDQMVPIITDFGLSRFEQNSETMSTHRFLSLGYCAPEYQFDGKMSLKSDMYSLGVIIIELVTGQKGIPDNKNDVLRRWRHRWNRSGKGTPLCYQQVSKCIDIGIVCQAKDPYARPFIWDIIGDINEMGCTNGKLSDFSGSMSNQTSSCFEDDMLGVEPLELHFPYELNMKTSCSLELTNETDNYIAFNIETMSPLPYITQPEKGTLSPRSKSSVNISLEAHDKSSRDIRHPCKFIMRSTKVNELLLFEDLTKEIFIKEDGNVVDEVNVDVVFDEQLTGPANTVSEVISLLSDSTETHVTKMAHEAKLTVSSDSHSPIPEEQKSMYESFDSSCL